MYQRDPRRRVATDVVLGAAARSSIPTRIDMQQDTTADPVVADIRNYYKVVLWTSGDFIETMLFAGRNLDTARDVFADYARSRPTARLTNPATDARAHAIQRTHPDWQVSL